MSLTDEDKLAIDKDIEDRWAQLKPRARAKMIAEIDKRDISADDVLVALSDWHCSSDFAPKLSKLLKRLKKKNPLAATAKAPEAEETWIDWARKEYEAPEFELKDLIQLHIKTVCVSLKDAEPPRPGAKTGLPADTYYEGWVGARMIQAMHCRHTCVEQLELAGKNVEQSRKWVDYLFAQEGFALPGYAGGTPDYSKLLPKCPEKTRARKPWKEAAKLAAAGKAGG